MRRRADAGRDRRVVHLREGVSADGDKWREKGRFIPRRAKVQRNRGRPLGYVVDVQKRPVFRRRLGCRHHGADCCQLHGQLASISVGCHSFSRVATVEVADLPRLSRFRMEHDCCIVDSPTASFALRRCPLLREFSMDNNTCMYYRHFKLEGACERRM